MMECARWPDDARGTLYDHPTWHYADRPIASDGAHAPDVTSGQAIEALQLNFLEASDAKAPAADRAIALCWVMHLAGDIHQPLHTASIYSKTYPQGDAGGTQQFIQDPDTRQVESLHWFWDDRVEKSADVRTIEANAADLRKALPARVVERTVRDTAERLCALGVRRKPRHRRRERLPGRSEDERDQCQRAGIAARLCANGF